MAPPYKPVFIVGHPRSGTTWTMWLLSQHPDVVASFHSGFFHHLDSIEKWRQEPGSFGKFIIPSLSAENVQTSNRSNRQVLWKDAVSPQIYTKQLREMTCQLFNTMAAYGSNPKVVVENTPENMEFMGWILELVPEAYVLHVCRDPRSIWLSIRNSFRSWMNLNGKGAFPPTLRQNILQWCRYQDLGREIQSRTNNYFEVKYERLKYDGINELMRLFHWLDLPADQEFCQQALANSTVEKLKDVMPSPKGFFGKAQADSWQNDLSKSDIKQIEYLAGDWMDKLDYKRQFPPLSTPPWQLKASKMMSRIAGFLRRYLYRW